MSIIKRYSADEDCIDWKAFDKRDWPGDKILKLLAAVGRYVDEHQLVYDLYDKFKDQMGSKFTGYVYSPWGKTKLTRGPE